MEDSVTLNGRLNQLKYMGSYLFYLLITLLGFLSLKVRGELIGDRFEIRSVEKLEDLPVSSVRKSSVSCMAFGIRLKPGV